MFGCLGVVCGCVLRVNEEKPRAECAHQTNKKNGELAALLADVTCRVTSSQPMKSNRNDTPPDYPRLPPTPHAMSSAQRIGRVCTVHARGVGTGEQGRWGMGRRCGVEGARRPTRRTLSKSTMTRGEGGKRERRRAGEGTGHSLTRGKAQ